MTQALNKQKLGIGTVQFGLPYGITNIDGQLDRGEAAEILNLAHEYGVRVLDTAHLYGDAERVIGDCLRLNGTRDFDIVTKTPAFHGGPINDDSLETLRATFDDSLSDLGVDRVYGLLVHHAEDLLCEGGEQIFECLVRWQQQGRCQRIGASVYSREQIDLLLARYPIDLMQMPFNVFDQRLLHDGTLDRLKTRGIEIHVRSIFLQGVVIAEPAQLPDRFQRFRNLLERYGETTKEHGCTRLSGALDFIRGITEIDNAIVGVSSLSEFREILENYDRPVRGNIDYMSFACSDEKLINPMCWSENNA